MRGWSRSRNRCPGAGLVRVAQHARRGECVSVTWEPAAYTFNSPEAAAASRNTSAQKIRIINRSCHGSPPSPSSSQSAAVYVCHWLIYYACDHCHQMRTFLQTLQNFATFYNFEGELTTAQGAILFLANNQSRNSSAYIHIKRRKYIIIVFCWQSLEYSAQHLK